MISANARAALRWRSTLSEKDSVVSAAKGDPVKKFVVVRSNTVHQLDMEQEARIAVSAWDFT